VRAVADCPVPVVSAVGHEQDTPLCDLAADARASTPTAAARLVVPDEGELRERLRTLRSRLDRAPLLLVERKRAALESAAGRLRMLSHQATLRRGYAIVRTDSGILRSATAVRPGERVEVELAEGGLDVRVEETRP
jgi:exodeoxyribonuclease VII large subunit